MLQRSLSAARQRRQLLFLRRQLQCELLDLLAAIDQTLHAREVQHNHTDEPQNEQENNNTSAQEAVDIAKASAPASVHRLRQHASVDMAHAACKRRSGSVVGQDHHAHSHGLTAQSTWVTLGKMLRAMFMTVTLFLYSPETQ